MLRHVNRYLDVNLTREHVLSTYSGYRPLVSSRDKKQGKSLSRTHAILESPAGLVSIVGGKLMTWRKMGQDTVDRLARHDHIPIRYPTEHLSLIGAERWRETAEELPRRAHVLGLDTDVVEHLGFYYDSGSLAILDLIDHDADLARRLLPYLPYIRAEIVHACRCEMALTLEDMLARRTHIAIEDHQRGVGVAADVAGLMALQLG